MATLIRSRLPRELDSQTRPSLTRSWSLTLSVELVSFELPCLCKKSLDWSVKSLFDRICANHTRLFSYAARFTLDNMKKEKNDLSRAVAAKKKADKKANIAEEQKQSKALDESIKA